MLVGKPFTRAPHAALYLIREQQCAGRIAEFPGGRKELSRDRLDAALTAAESKGPAAPSETLVRIALAYCDFAAGN